MNSSFLQLANTVERSNQPSTTYSSMGTKSRLLIFLLLAVCFIVSLEQVSAFDEPNFYPMDSLTWRNFAHRRPHIKFDRPGRDIPDRTCGAMLGKRIQRLCMPNCPPPGMTRIALTKRSLQKKTLLTSLCCIKPCSDDLIRQMFCCAGP